MKKSTILQGLGIAALLISLLIMVACNTETPEARSSSYSTACYREQGGSKWVCSDGGEMEFQNGATLDVQDGATVTLADSTIYGSLIVTGTSDLQGNVSDSLGNFTIADNAVVTGTLTANGAGDFDLTLNVDGASTLGGLLTLNDSLIVTGTSDLQGNVADSLGDFTVADNAIVTGTVDVQGASLQYGPNNLYPLGASASGFQGVWGTTTITNSGTVAHGLTSPAWGTCAYSGTLTDNEEQLCSVDISGATVTIYTYKEAGTAGDSGVAIYWMVIGTP